MRHSTDPSMAMSALIVLSLVKLALGALPWAQQQANLPGFAPKLADGRCPVFPSQTSPWNQDISSLAVHPNSAAIKAMIGNGRYLHPDFGGQDYDSEFELLYGIPINYVDSSKTGLVPITFDDYDDESDAGPYPIPTDVRIEASYPGCDPNVCDGDKHVILVDTSNCTLYETYNTVRQQDGWHASNGAKWDLKTNRLRPFGWTSADAAGLPIYAGLVRASEVKGGTIKHALRFTGPNSRRAYEPPAMHYAGHGDMGPSSPWMGMRVRMNQTYDCSKLSQPVQVICKALKTYGAIFADNGSPWFITGEATHDWDDILDEIQDLKKIPSSAMDVVASGCLCLNAECTQGSCPAPSSPGTSPWPKPPQPKPPQPQASQPKPPQPKPPIPAPKQLPLTSSPMPPRPLPAPARWPPPASSPRPAPPVINSPRPTPTSPRLPSPKPSPPLPSWSPPRPRPPPPFPSPTPRPRPPPPSPSPTPRPRPPPPSPSPTPRPRPPPPSPAPIPRPRPPPPSPAPIPRPRPPPPSPAPTPRPRPPPPSPIPTPRLLPPLPPRKPVPPPPTPVPKSSSPPSTARPPVSLPPSNALLWAQKEANLPGWAPDGPSGCPVFPANSHWNRDVTNAPVHPDSDVIKALISNDRYLHPDFGGGPDNIDGPQIYYGIPINHVDSRSIPMQGIEFDDYEDQSDPGPYPIPPAPEIEGAYWGCDPDICDGDRHLILVDHANCTLYETWNTALRSDGWHASNGAKWDLRTNKLRPYGWTSGDAAGLPIYPGLVQASEVKSGVIRHALRFTGPNSRLAYQPPATHFAGSGIMGAYSPWMGMQVRMKKNYNCSALSTPVQVICTALKTYGAIFADNGSPWYISGEATSEWDDILDDIQDLKRVPPSAMEVVVTGCLCLNDECTQGSCPYNYMP